MAEKLLVVNADDFGFTRDVNAGIAAAHRDGILTATTLMANGAAFDDAVALARATPSLDVGCHLVLTGGESVAGPGRALPRDVPALLAALARREFSVERELDAQIRRILAAGIQPTHLDTHKHTHLLPPVLAAVARLAARYSILWVRRPFDFPIRDNGVPPLRRLISRSLGLVRRRFHLELTRHGCRTTDHFAGFGVTGLLREQELLHLLNQLPAGSTELMTHPGICGPELQAARTRLKESRQRELEALTSAATRAAIQSLGIRLVGYRAL